MYALVQVTFFHRMLVRIIHVRMFDAIFMHTFQFISTLSIIVIYQSFLFVCTSRIQVKLCVCFRCFVGSLHFCLGVTYI